MRLQTKENNAHLYALLEPLMNAEILYIEHTNEASKQRKTMPH